MLTILPVIDDCWWSTTLRARAEIDVISMQCRAFPAQNIDYLINHQNWRMQSSFIPTVNYKCSNTIDNLMAPASRLSTWSSTNFRQPTPCVRKKYATFILSRVSMQCLQSAILFYQYSVCLSASLSVFPMPLLCLNEPSYRHISLTIR